MITAVDTNILLDILVPNEDFFEASAAALQESRAIVIFTASCFPRSIFLIRVSMRLKMV